MIRRALKLRRNPATRSSTIDALLPDRQRSRSTWRRLLLRVRKLMVPAIAALLSSAAAGYGQAPADGGVAPKFSGSVEQRWPADEAAEPASRKSDEEIQPVPRETTPAPPQDQKVQPEISQSAAGRAASRTKQSRDGAIGRGTGASPQSGEATPCGRKGRDAKAAPRGKGRHAKAEPRGRKDRNEAKENPARQSAVSAKQRFRAATQRAATVWFPVRRSAARI